jgi:hypothetical protein
MISGDLAYATALLSNHSLFTSATSYFRFGSALWELDGFGKLPDISCDFLKFPVLKTSAEFSALYMNL